MKVRVAILGAGPCGLGAAYRLKELGENDFGVFEATEHPGGLASSYVDDQGFTWDVGGHVQFSHYEDFDRVMNEALPNGWIHHQRESWVWIRDRFVPYPFQNNLWRLPEEDQRACVEGLKKLQGQSEAKLKNFGDWISASFGEGLANLFMRPYNLKVWAHPPESMTYDWIGERVATVDLKQIETDIAAKKDRVSWGPNATFQFPKRGGTGAIWKAVAERIGKPHLHLQHRLVELDAAKKKMIFEVGQKNRLEVSYDVAISAIPLNRLAKLAGLRMSREPLFSKSHIVGIGLKGTVPDSLKTKCWMYFPESNAPFYRVTVFSNYSPENVPDPQNQWSLMCETASSTHRPVDDARIVDETIEGLLNTKLIQSKDQIISKWKFTADPGYPTPFLGRDDWLRELQSQLENFKIYSRGRFGAWKYEVSNQDHTFMQGFEWADWLIRGTPEMTMPFPQRANASGKRPKL